MTEKFGDIEIWDKRERDLAWRKLFLGSSQGRTVLVELLNECNYNHSLFSDDTAAMARNVGRYEIAQLIMNRISCKASEMHQLVTEFQMAEMRRREQEMRETPQNDFKTPEVRAL